MTKGLKSLKEIFDAVEAVDENANCHFDMEELADMFGDVEKELKALEIIKSKLIPYIDTLEPFTKMTKKEYDLLKEVLL